MEINEDYIRGSQMRFQDDAQPLLLKESSVPYGKKSYENQDCSISSLKRFTLAVGMFLIFVVSRRPSVRVVTFQR